MKNLKNTSYAAPFGTDAKPAPTLSVEVTERTYEMLFTVRDMWFPPNELDDPMPIGDFINVMCCSIIYRKHRKKK